jgi:hypothetical protein
MIVRLRRMPAKQNIPIVMHGGNLDSGVAQKRV